MGDALNLALAGENRCVLSGWRAVVYLNRASDETSVENRRWKESPKNLGEVRLVLARLVQNGEFQELEEFEGLYRTNAPFARAKAIEEEEVLMEMHPYAALSHFSALAFHGLTPQLPKELHASIPKDGGSGIVPIGTSEADRSTFAIIRGREVNSIFGRAVHWHRLNEDRIFGSCEYTHHGFPLRVTTPERTLLDGLMYPDKCGGFATVLRAWAASRDLLDVNQVVRLTERFEVAVLRQRVGYLLEELNLTHAALESWVRTAKRGGAYKLNGGAEFTSTVDPRWLISINASMNAFMQNLEEVPE